MRPPGVVEAVFVRSSVPHARVPSVDCTAALSMPGVIGVFTSEDLDLQALRPWKVDPVFSREPLATVARYVGDPVAVVVAESERQALDAANMVWPDYDELPHAVDPLAALDPGSPLLFPESGSNLAMAEQIGEEHDPLAGADVVVRHRFVNQRVAPVPMEGGAALCAPQPDGRLTAWIGTQDPFGAKADLASVLGIPAERIRVIAPAVGGGFGAKGDLYPEHAVVAALALKLERPVRWVERRTENMINMVHGRNQIQDVAIGATHDGRVTGLSIEIVANVGAYPAVATWLPRYTLEMASGTYAFPLIKASFKSVATNTTPGGPYRGAGRPEAIQMVERAMDLLAVELGMDPVELRRRNLIAPFNRPHRTATGALYDSGDYALALDRVLALGSHADWIAERDRRRTLGFGLQLGVGVSTYVEVTVGATPDRDHGSVEVRADGTILAKAGGSSHGQGHATAFAMIVADRFDLPIERVVVVQSDTDQVARGGGTYASRTLQLAGSSLYEASDTVVDSAKELASQILEAAPEDIIIVPDRGLGVKGSPDAVVEWADLAAVAAGRGIALSASSDRSQGASTYPFGAHLAVIELDPETGWCRLVSHVAVDDCGRLINPMLVKGQQHGGIAQGAGQALFEHMRYDSNGMPLTANLASYSIPTAGDLPSFAVSNTITPTPLNPLGAKGVGEAGTLGSTPAIHSAVMDAMAPFGVTHLDMPLTPERVWSAIHGY